MQQSDIISLNTANTVHLIRVKDILYCKSDNSYTTFYLVNHDPVVVSQSIKSIELNLGSPHFIRTHQTYLVNIEHIKEIKKASLSSLTLSDNSVIPVSTRKRKDIMEKLLNNNKLKSINN